MNQIEQKIHDLTKYSYIVLQKRCNIAIRNSLKLLRSLGYTHLYIPNEGGWMTYEPFGKKEKFEIHFLKTKKGIIQDFTPEPKSVLLFHTLAGYHSMQDAQKLVQRMHEHGGVVIEDICGSIGAKPYGDIVVCSFGKGKPVDFGSGGFLATEKKEWFDVLRKTEVSLDAGVLTKLENLPTRMEFLRSKVQQCKKDLSQFNPIADKDGIVLIVPFQTDTEKTFIKKYAQKRKIQFEECPRYIRTNMKALSLEIKRQ